VELASATVTPKVQRRCSDQFMAIRYEFGIGRRLGMRPGYRTGLVQFGFGGAGLGGDDSWRYNHSDEGEGDQEVMHGGGLLGLSSSELFHSLIIGPIRKFLNPT
jgi:hypothetical protein